MNCEELRAQWLEDPANLSAAAREHLAHCLHCEEFDRIGQQREALLNQAFALPQADNYTSTVVAATAPDRIVRKPRVAIVRWLPMAAAASLAAVVGVQFIGAPTNSHATAVATAAFHHAGHDGNLVIVSAPDDATIDSVLAKMGMAWEGAREVLTFAEICPLSEMKIAHLVVRDIAGEVEVMVLPESEHAAMPSSHEGKLLQIVSIGGRQAVLVAESEIAMKSVAQQLKRQLVASTA